MLAVLECLLRSFTSVIVPTTKPMVLCPILSMVGRLTEILTRIPTRSLMGLLIGSLLCLRQRRMGLDLLLLVGLSDLPMI